MVRAIQEVLDPLCLIGVEINPESRVKAVQGPAAAVAGPARLAGLPGQGPQRGGRDGRAAGREPQRRARLPAVDRRARARSRRSRPAEVADRWMDVAMFGDRPLKPDALGPGARVPAIQVYSRDAGRREAKLSFNVGQGTQDLGFRSDVDVLFTCEPAVSVVLDVRDDDGRPTMASFLIRDALGRVYPSPTPPARPRLLLPPPGLPHERRDGRCCRRARTPSRSTRGPEYLTSRRGRSTVPEGGDAPRVVRAEALDPPGEAGLVLGRPPRPRRRLRHYESPTEGVTPEDMMRHILGEDLDVGCVLSWGPCWYAQKAFFDGKLHPLSTPDYLMRYDVEVSGFPSSHAGHLCLLRLKEDDYPGTTRIEEWPSWDLPVLKWGKSQGGVVGFSHSGWGLKIAGRRAADLRGPAVRRHRRQRVHRRRGPRRGRLHLDGRHARPPGS